MKVFLGIHIHTVFSIDHPFQTVREVDSNTLNGPGVVDAKGGLIVLLTALEALERSDFAQAVGWEVLINPDEEIGSPSSAKLLAECTDEITSAWSTNPRGRIETPSARKIATFAHRPRKSCARGQRF